MRARRRNLLRGCFPVEFGRGLKARAHGLVPRRACGRALARARCRGLLTAPSCSPRRRFWLTGVTVLVITRPPSIRCCAIARRPTDCALRPRGFDRRFDRSGQSIRHGAVVHCARRCRGHIAAGRSAGLDHTRQVPNFSRRQQYISMNTNSQVKFGARKSYCKNASRTREILHF